MTELVVQEGVRADLLAQATPNDMLAQATKVADVLKDVIVKQNLISKIGGKDHVKVEGWNIMGCMLGILSREKEVIEEEDGSFLATVELYNMRTGAVVGTGSAICGMDESRWGKADRFARRSMAITRATGKAYRLNFSWVMGLAGYAVTPEEEMPNSPSNAAIYTGTTEQQLRLKAYLQRQKVPEQYWEEINDKMYGQPSAAAKSVIARVQAGDDTPP